MSGRHALPPGAELPASPVVRSTGYRRATRHGARYVRRRALLGLARVVGLVLALMAAAIGAGVLVMNEASAGRWFSVSTSGFTLAALACAAAGLILRHREHGN